MLHMILAPKYDSDFVTGILMMVFYKRFLKLPMKMILKIYLLLLTWAII